MGIAQEWLEDRRFRVEKKADIPGARLDLAGRKYSKDRLVHEILIEVETCDSIGLPHAAEQVDAMDRYVLALRKKRKLKSESYLVVPKRCVQDGKLVVRTITNGDTTVRIMGL